MTLFERLSKLSDEDLESFIAIIVDNKNKNLRWNEFSTSKVKEKLSVEYNILKGDFLISGGIEQVTRDFFSYKAKPFDIEDFRNHLQEKVRSQKAISNNHSKDRNDSKTEFFDPLKIGSIIGLVVGFVIFTPIVWLIVTFFLVVGSGPLDDVSERHPTYLSCIEPYDEIIGLMSREKRRETVRDCKAEASNKDSMELAWIIAAIFTFGCMAFAYRELEI